MKKYILCFTIIVSAFIVSCERFNNDIIVDWAPVSLNIIVHDSDGNDLLNPENPNNIIEGTSIKYKGKIYKANMDWYNESVKTRAYLPTLYGLFLVNDEMTTSWNGKYPGFHLIFGEIDGAEDMDEDFVVTWPDGSTDIIHYHCSNHNERKLSCDRSWKLNGTKMTNPIVIIK